MIRLVDALEVFFKRLVQIQAHRVTPRNHERANLPIIEPKHIADHGVLVRLDHPRCRAFDQHGVNLFFGHRTAAGLFDPEQTQQRAGGGGQQNDKRLGGNRQKN